MAICLDKNIVGYAGAMAPQGHFVTGGDPGPSPSQAMDAFAATLPEHEVEILRAKAEKAINEELDRISEGPLRSMVAVLLQIAKGELPRPVHGDATSRPMIAAMAGVHARFTYKTAAAATFDRLLPLLAFAPGTVMRKKVGGGVEPSDPTFVYVRDGLRAHLRAGGKLATVGERHAKSISKHAISELLNVPYEDIVLSTATLEHLQMLSRLPNVLGDVWEGASWSAMLTQHKAAMFAWLDAKYAAGEALPEDPAKPGHVDHKGIRDSVGPNQPSLVRCAEYDRRIKLHLAEDGPGLASAAVLPPQAPRVGEVVENILRLFAAERAASGKDPKGGRHELKTAMGRVLQARELEENDDWPKDLFVKVDMLIRDAAEVGRPLAKSSVANLRTQIGHAARFAPAAAAVDDGLPELPHECLKIAIERSRKSLAELEGLSTIPGTKRCIPGYVISALSLGRRPFPERYWECLPHLERGLGIEGALVKRWKPCTMVKNVSCSPYFRQLGKKMRRILPEGSHLLSDAEVRMLVKERQDKVLRQDTMYSKCQRASRMVMRNVPKLPPGAPVLKEINQLVAFKTVAVPESAIRRTNSDWSEASVKLNTKRFIMIARFALMSTELGGLGKSSDEISLAMILNWKVIAAFLNWRAGRYAHVVHDGKTRGVVLTQEDMTFIGQCVALLDPVYGWIRQRPDLFASKVVVDETLLADFESLEELRISRRRDTSPCGTKNEAEILKREEEFDETFSKTVVERRVMSPETAALLKEDWLLGCAMAHNRLSNLRSYLTKLISRGRDPFEVIHVIVYSKNRDPLSFVRDIARAAQADLPDSKLKPFEHAIAVRDLLIFTLTALTALRSRNIRELSYNTEKGGQVEFTEDGVLLTIPWWEFKNMGSTHLFNDHGNKMDYQRLVKNWYNLDNVLQHYLDVCRPILIERYSGIAIRDATPEELSDGKVRTTTDALFPVPSLEYMDVISFNQVFRNLTGRYHVIDPATGIVRPGYSSFGPHAMRDIVAMHIILASDDESRWQEAADLLQTSPEMVRKRYTRRLIVNRTGKADHHFDQSNDGYEAVMLC